MTVIRFLGVVSVCVLLAACGGSSPGDGPGNGRVGSSDGGSSGAQSAAGGPGGGSSTAGASAGGASAGGALTGGTAGAASAKSGTVTFSSFHANRMGSLGAAFGNGGTSPCVDTQAGACTISLCDVSGSAPTLVSAGTITFTSPDLTGSATATPDANGVYTSQFNFATGGFLGGERGTFKATGGDVPAFEADLGFPLVILLSKPVVTTDKVSVPRGQDLSLEWTRGAAGVYFYALAASLRADGKPGSTQLQCQVPSEGGAMTIPASALSALLVASTVDLYTASVKTVTAGDFSISLDVVTDIATPDKKLFPSFELQ